MQRQDAVATSLCDSLTNIPLCHTFGVGEKVARLYCFLHSDRHLRCEAVAPLFNFVNFGITIKIYKKEHIYLIFK